MWRIVGLDSLHHLKEIMKTLMSSSVHKKQWWLIFMSMEFCQCFIPQKCIYLQNHSLECYSILCIENRDDGIFQMILLVNKPRVIISLRFSRLIFFSRTKPSVIWCWNVCYFSYIHFYHVKGYLPKLVKLLGLIRDNWNLYVCYSDI